MDTYEQAAADLVDAEARMREAEARAWLTSQSGLNYAILDEDETEALVMHDGIELGFVYQDRPGQVLHGWTAYNTGGHQVGSTFRMARTAASALLQAYNEEVSEATVADP